MKVIKLLWNNVFRHCKALIILILISCSVYAFSLIPIFVQKTYFDKLEQFLTSDYAFFALLFWLFVFYVTRSISGGFLIPLSGAKDLYYEYTVTYQVRRSQHRMNNLVPLEDFDSEAIYNLMQRADEALTSGALRSTVNAIASFLTMFISLVSMLISLFVINHYFVIFAVILVVPMFIEYFWFEKKIYLIERSLVTTKRKQNFCASHICDKEYFFQTRISGAAPCFIEEWEAYRQSVEQLYDKIHIRKLLFGLISGVFKSGSIVIMVIIGLHLLSEGSISIGSFSVLIGVIGMIMSYMDFFISTLSQSIVRIGELREVSAYYDIPGEEQTPSPSSHIGDIELKNVSFKYSSRDVDALSNINKVFKKGEKVAIFGMNGAGKTTLTNIIMGAFTPTQGQVQYDGIDISLYDKNLWREKISAVFQDFQIYNVTVYDNVFLGNIRKERDQEKLDEALQQANFPLQKHHGDQMIGRMFGGIELSRGEAQKLAMARSYYNSDAEIVIIDEPTAALDPIAEEELYQSFINDSEDKTLFIVSHRMGSARIADRILVMDSAEIVEDGTHEQLLALNGIYAKIYKEQAVLYDR